MMQILDVLNCLVDDGGPITLNAFIPIVYTTRKMVSALLPDLMRMQLLSRLLSNLFQSRNKTVVWHCQKITATPCHFRHSEVQDLFSNTIIFQIDVATGEGSRWLLLRTQHQRKPYQLHNGVYQSQDYYYGVVGSGVMSSLKALIPSDMSFPYDIHVTDRLSEFIYKMCFFCSPLNYVYLSNY